MTDVMEVSDMFKGVKTAISKILRSRSRKNDHDISAGLERVVDHYW